MLEFPMVSIIIPVYNGGTIIGDCLASLGRLNYPRDLYEVIVVENGSTDNTVEVVKQYPVIFLNCEKRGPAPARNLGLQASKAEIAAFLDADCVAHCDWLAELVRPFQDPQVGAAAGLISSYPRPEGNFIDRFSDQFPPLVNFWSGPGEFLPHLYTANASYRRAPLIELGGFNPSMQTGEDVDLSWRFQLHTDYKVVYVPEAVVYHRHRSTSASLARQYRQYGYGEIILDTLYRKYPGYPRTPSYQMKRILRQIRSLPTYASSVFVRRLRYMFGKAAHYDAVLPWLWLMVELNNIRGKIEAVLDTRLMSDASRALQKNPNRNIKRFY